MNRDCRLLPYSVADGPNNMAADESLLHCAVDGTASLRFYGWSQPTLSLGYFQSEQTRQADPRLAALPFVRRPSGGAALVHEHEVTYALALPADSYWNTRKPWLNKMHAIIGAALEKCSVPVQVHRSASGAPYSESWCFLNITTGDLLVGQSKICGSAQRRRSGALLQHGVILLAVCRHTPILPGIFELCGRRLDAQEVCACVAQEFSIQTGCTLLPADWTPKTRSGAFAIGF